MKGEIKFILCPDIGVVLSSVKMYSNAETMSHACKAYFNTMYVYIEGGIHPMKIISLELVRQGIQI